MADVADGRHRADARASPSFRQIQCWQGALCRGALPEGGQTPLWRARQAAGGPRVCRRRLLDRRYFDLAVDLALRVADDRYAPVSQREALVSGDRQAPRDPEGLQSAE